MALLGLNFVTLQTYRVKCVAHGHKTLAWLLLELAILQAKQGVLLKDAIQLPC